MNTLIIAVILVIVFLLIFVMFSLDDHDEEEGFLTDDTSSTIVAEDQAEKVKEILDSQPSVLPAPEVHETLGGEPEIEAYKVETSITVEEQSDIFSKKAETVEETSKASATQKASDTSSPKNKKEMAAEIETGQIKEETYNSELPERLTLPNIGGEEDLRFRINIHEKLPVANGIKQVDCIVAVLQFRMPEELEKNPDKFLRMLQRAEKVLEADFSFPFLSYSLNQLSRLWIFTPETDSEVSDPLFESLVVTSEAINRFKNALRADSLLSINKIRISIGMSMGRIFKLSHGIANPTSWYGTPIYMAEALADTALDLKIYVDELIHNEVLPLFDFREWKPVALRANMEPSKMFELVGWTTPDEMVSYASYEDPAARRTVAVAFRYLEFLDDKISVLLSLASDPNESVRYEALETIKAIASERTLGVLKNIFPDAKNPEFRAIILDAFGEIGSPEVMPIVLGSTKESNWRVRLSAARTLHRLCGKESLKNLESLLEDVDDSVRVIVNHIFYKETQNPTYLNAIMGMVSSLSKRTRFNAVKSLLDVGTDASIKEVINAFTDQDTDIKRYILKRLELNKSKVLYPSFLTLFKNSSEEIRVDIIEAMKRAGIEG